MTEQQHSPQQAYIADVTADNLAELIEFSHKIPLWLQFWQPQHEASITAVNHLVGLAQLRAGDFILAKVHIGQQSEIAQRLGVTQAPASKLIVKGEIVAQSDALLTEQKYRELLAPHVPAEASEVLRQQAQVAFAEGDLEQVLQLLAQATSVNPNNFLVHLDLVQMYLLQGHLDKAQTLFDKLPDEAKQSADGKRTLGLLFFSGIVAEADDLPSIQQALDENPQNPAALYALAGYLVLHNQPEQAMEALFTLFKADRGYNEGAAQKALIQLFTMLTPTHPQWVAQARRTLQGLLY